MILLKNATFINYQTLEFKQTDILVEEGINAGYKLVNSGEAQADTIIDCTGKFVTKAFGCGHHHVYSALARGMNAPKKIPENFVEILQYVWWTLDKCLDKEMIELSALTTAIASARAGVTFVIDHHASPFAIDGSLEILAKAFEKVGVSHLLCYEITDRDGLDKAEQGLIETENYLQKYQGLVGLHASFTVSNDTLTKAVELARKYNSGIHVHVAEDLADQKACIEKHGKRVVERFHEAGALDFSKTILGHCLHIDDNERKLLNDSKAWVVQNTESNLNNNVGFFSSKGIGERIMLGTDGMHSDMLRSAKNSFFVGQHFDSIGYDGVYNRFRKAHQYIKDNDFKGDGCNNLVVLDYRTPTEMNQNNFYGHFLFGIESSHVQHVIANGKLIVKDREIVNINEEEILKASAKAGKKLWEKMSS